MNRSTRSRSSLRAASRSAQALIAALTLLAFAPQAFGQLYSPGYDAPQAPGAEYAPPDDPSWSRQPIYVFVPVPVPVPPREVYRPLTGLWAAGMAVLVGSWLLDITFTALFDRGSTGTSAIPVAGPWLQFGEKREKDNEAAARALTGLSGAVQAAGAAMFVVGLSVWRKQPVRRRWSLAPSLGRESAGLSLTLSLP